MCGSSFPSPDDRNFLSFGSTLHITSPDYQTDHFESQLATCTCLHALPGLHGKDQLGVGGMLCSAVGQST